MKEIDKNELMGVDGGWMRLVGLLVGGLTYELLTEGFAQCVEDFKEGYESTHGNW